MESLDERKCIMIPPHGKPLIINFKDAHNYIGGTTDHRTPYWLDDEGYKLALICADMSPDHTLNTLATKIGKLDMFGNCVLVDDDIDLNYKELAKILTLSKEYKKFNGHWCK